MQAVVTEKCVMVPPDLTVDVALQRMQRQKVSCVLVTRKGKLLGILTERDVQRRVGGRGHDPQRTSVADVMTAPVVTVQKGTPLPHVLAIMQIRGLAHVPVTNAARTHSSVPFVYRLRPEGADSVTAFERNMRSRETPASFSPILSPLFRRKRI